MCTFCPMSKKTCPTALRRRVRTSLRAWNWMLLATVRLCYRDAVPGFSVALHFSMKAVTTPFLWAKSPTTTVPADRLCCMSQVAMLWLPEKQDPLQRRPHRTSRARPILKTCWATCLVVRTFNLSMACAAHFRSASCLTQTFLFCHCSASSSP